MPKSIQPLLEMLCRAEQPSGKRLIFHWRLIRRHGRPLLLLPENSMDVRWGLELYSAQRRRAKIWRTALPRILRTPAVSLFQRITFEADTGSKFIRILSEQSGVPVDQLRAPSVKFGGVGEKKLRLALLVCDQTDRPAKVIKRLGVLVDQHIWVQIQDREQRRELRDEAINLLIRAWLKSGNEAQAARIRAIRDAEEILLK